MKRIGVLRGGVSPEYDISLKTGAAVQQALFDAGFEAIDMLLDKEGVLHIKGVPIDMEKVGVHVDKVWNALHGTFGEDGGAQTLFGQHNLSLTGSDATTSALFFNKERAKEKAKELGILTPTSLLIIPETGDSIAEVSARIYRTMAPPWVIKPLRGGSSVRTFFAFTPLDLSQIVEESLSYTEPFLVEQYISGTEVAVGVIDNFRNKERYVLPVVDIESPSRGILTKEKRLENHTAFPSKLRPSDRETVSGLAQQLHESLGVKDYSQSEFIVDRFGKIWFIETDTHPALHQEAPFYKALEAVGATLVEFVRSVLKDE